MLTLYVKYARQLGLVSAAADEPAWRAVSRPMHYTSTQRRTDDDECDKQAIVVGRLLTTFETTTGRGQIFSLADWLYVVLLFLFLLLFVYFLVVQFLDK